MCEEVVCVDCVPCQLPAFPVLLQAEGSVAAQYVHVGYVLLLSAAILYSVFDCMWWNCCDMTRHFVCFSMHCWL